MGKILKTPQSKAQAKPRQIMQPAKAILNDQDTYFKVHTLTVLLI